MLTPGTYPVNISPARFAATIVRHTPGQPFPTGPTNCRAALLGIPDDTGVHLNQGRPGARLGPAALRDALARYGSASPAIAADDGTPLIMPTLLDAGDIVPADSLDATHDRVTAAATALLQAGIVPIAVGGGHDLTFPFARAACTHAGVTAGLYLDAHLDVRPTPGSGMPFRALIERCGLRALSLVGFNPLANSREHLDYFSAHHGRLRPPATTPAEALAHIHAVTTAAGPAADGSPARAFVSIDLDAIDAAHAPGVSALNPAGLAPATAALYATAAGRCPLVACFDIMELNPAHDHDGRTARLAAHLVLCFLVGLAQRPR